MKRTKTAQAATERATALVDTVRPLVQRAMNDPELHDALRSAFATGREVSGEIGGTPPRKAARKLARDQKLQKRVSTSAHDLQRAVSGLVEKPRRRGRVRRALRAIVVVGGAAGAAVLVLKKLKGGDAGPGAGA